MVGTGGRLEELSRAVAERGFAQYFAALYAERDRGDEVFSGMLRQMRRWAIDQSIEGPVYLGYRLGHIKGDGRVFRALVYNKGAMVLHMLRRWSATTRSSGPAPVLRDVEVPEGRHRRLPRAMEKADRARLVPFFDALDLRVRDPALAFTSTIAGAKARVRLEHRARSFPTPVTVTAHSTSTASEDVVVPVTEQDGRADPRR